LREEAVVGCKNAGEYRAELREHVKKEKEAAGKGKVPYKKEQLPEKP